MIGQRSPLRTLIATLFPSVQSTSAPQKGFISRLLSRDRPRPERPPGITDDHQFQRDGTHDHDKCKECSEIDMLLAHMPASTRTSSDINFEGRYKFEKNPKIIGKGATGVVRLAIDCNSKQVLAVKEFRKRRKSETLEMYLTRLTDEFLIAQRLSHPNTVKTIDIVRYHHRWYEVMEYCEAGDMFSLMRKRKFSEDEINCCFRQLVEGCKYLHLHGIAHRDLKLENTLVDAQGNVKIGDFGMSKVFRVNEWDEELKSCGVCGSIPYIAPEEFVGGEYDPRPVDVWSLAIIYYAMTFHSVPWRVANQQDGNFVKYLKDGMPALEPFSRLAVGPRALLRKMLEPDPAKRITIDQIYKDPWFVRLKLCQLIMDGEEGSDVEDGSRYEYRADQLKSR